SHLDECHSNIQCELCNEKFSSTSILDKHKTDSCPKALITCPLEKYGCADKVIRSQFGTHLLHESHQGAILSFIQLIESKFGPLDITDRNISSITHILTNSNVPSSTAVKQENVIDQHFMECENIEPAQNSSNANIETQINDLYATHKKCYELLMTLSQGIQTITQETNRLSTDSLRLNNSIQTIYKESNDLKKSMEEKDIYLAGIAPNQEILQQELSSIKEKIDSMEFRSFDGTLTWKVSDVSEKMADAQSERQTSIYSPAFYSSPTGYKMRVRLYLHGDGNARRTHMSLFFVLMRGDYDSILKWPFNFKVTFCLYDQSGQNRHVIDSFRPDTKSNSFQRPRSDMNIASGIPKFFPLPMIQQDGNNYVRDDTMFIKVIVDFADMPKMILPYALSLNPGLPHHVQQYLIKQEIQKRQQAPTMPATVPPPPVTSTCG
ncbi:unnamed protein product, partial [Didymodactylos carnosus]